MAVAPLHFSVGAGVGVFVGVGVGEGVGAGEVGAAVGAAVGVGVGERELGVSLHHRCDSSCAPNLTTFVLRSQQWSGSSEMSPLGVSPLHLAPSGFFVGAGVGSGVGDLVGLGVGDDVGAGVLMLVHHFWCARLPICVCSVFRSQQLSAGMAVTPLHVDPVGSAAAATSRLPCPNNRALAA